jgi:hypothetical protein
VPAVDALVGAVLWEVVDQVAVVVQHRCGDQRRRGAILLGGVGHLKRVFKNRDALAIVASAAFAEGGEDLIDDGIVGHAHLPFPFDKMTR